MHLHFLVHETQSCRWDPSQCYSGGSSTICMVSYYQMPSSTSYTCLAKYLLSEIEFSISHCLLRDLRYALSDLTRAFIVTGLSWPHSTRSWLLGSYCSFPLKSHFFHSDQLVESYVTSHLVTLTSLALWLSSGHTLWSFLTNTCCIFLVSSWKESNPTLLIPPLDLGEKQ